MDNYTKKNIIKMAPGEVRKPDLQQPMTGTQKAATGAGTPDVSFLSKLGAAMQSPGFVQGLAQLGIAISPSKESFGAKVGEATLSSSRNAQYASALGKVLSGKALEADDVIGLSPELQTVLSTTQQRTQQMKADADYRQKQIELGEREAAVAERRAEATEEQVRVSQGQLDLAEKEFAAEPTFEEKHKARLAEIKAGKDPYQARPVGPIYDMEGGKPVVKFGHYEGNAFVEDGKMALSEYQAATGSGGDGAEDEKKWRAWFDRAFKRAASDPEVQRYGKAIVNETTGEIEQFIWKEGQGKEGAQIFNRKLFEYLEDFSDLDLDLIPAKFLEMFPEMPELEEEQPVSKKDDSEETPTINLWGSY